MEHWGIQIYAAIDTYSRCIMWIYVGITGRTAVSVWAQYIQTLASGGVMPEYLRTDRGAETTMAADAHYELSKQIRTRSELAEDSIAFEDCFKFGTSKANQRIESWWAQACKTSLARWTESFWDLSNSNQFSKSSLVDRIALFAVYVPIIRVTANTFVTLWNRHTIRKQSKLPHAVPGIPAILYNYPELSNGEQCGFTVPAESLLPFQKDLEGFGKRYVCLFTCRMPLSADLQAITPTLTFPRYGRVSTPCCVRLVPRNSRRPGTR
jgi:hypothetical protein